MRKNLENRINIQGRIQGHDLKKKVTGEHTKNPGTEFISGTLDVATDDEGLNVVTVHFTYVTATTSKGQENRTFTALDKIMNEGKTVLVDGFENATIVRIDTAIGLNDFYSDRAKTDTNPDGLVSAKRAEGGFVTICGLKDIKSKQEERNKFQVDMLINGCRRVEADPERHIDNDYVIIKGAVFDFRGSLLPVEFYVRSEGGMSYFESLDISASNPSFKKVWGNIVSETVTFTSTQESAFGEAVVRESNRTHREWVVTGASPEAYEIGDEENGITTDEIKQLMADRNVRLAEVKKNAEEWAAQRNAGAATTASTSQATAPAAAGGFDF